MEASYRAAGLPWTGVGARRLGMLRLVLVAPCRRTLEHWAIWVGCGASASVALMIDGAILTLLLLGGSLLTALRLRRKEALWSSIAVHRAWERRALCSQRGFDQTFGGRSAKSRSELHRLHVGSIFAGRNTRRRIHKRAKDCAWVGIFPWLVFPLLSGLVS